MDSPSDKELQPVEALAQDLRALAGPSLLVPKRVDDAVLAMARRQMNHRRRGRFAAGAAAAAILLAVGGVWLLSDQPFARRTPSAESESNGGRSDVLDLLALALKAESRAPLDANGDLPHDGMVDGKDLSALARNIVRVSDAQDAGGASGIQHDGRCTIDIYVDSGAQRLAAYQVEFTDPTGRIKIIGVEGGEPAAFKAPPYYDPAALGSGRIILAAYSTNRDLPMGKVCVARLRVVSAEREPNYILRLCTAGTSDGNKVPARLFIAQQGNEFNQRGPSPQGGGEGAVSDVLPVRKVEILDRV